VARRHNALNISEPLDGSVRQVRDRPAMVLGAQRFVDACLATVRDPCSPAWGRSVASTSLLTIRICSATRRLAATYEK
jgi:hypothetical protein